MLQYLQQNQTNLTSQQQTIFQQLTHQYRLMQQHQQQLRLQQQQQRIQQPQVQVNNSVTVRPGQQFQGQPGFQQQQTATRQPIQNGTVNQPGFDVDGSGNFPVATGHTQPAAGMPYKSANIQNAGFQSFQSQGFTQANSSGNNQLDLGKFFFIIIFFDRIKGGLFVQ